MIYFSLNSLSNSKQSFWIQIKLETNRNKTLTDLKFLCSSEINIHWVTLLCVNLSIKRKTLKKVSVMMSLRRLQIMWALEGLFKVSLSRLIVSLKRLIHCEPYKAAICWAPTGYTFFFSLEACLYQVSRTR